MASDMNSPQSSQSEGETGQAKVNGVAPSSSTNHVPPSYGDSGYDSSPKLSPTIVKHSVLRTEVDVTQPRLSNGLSNHDDTLIESSVDADISDPSAIEVTEDEQSSNQGSEPSPNGSPQMKEKDTLTISHQRDDSSSSLISAGPVEMLTVDTPEPTPRLESIESTTSLLSHTSSTKVMIKGGWPIIEGDFKRGNDQLNDDPTPAERAVAYSPAGRFLKYDIEIGRGSFKTVYKGLDTETGVAIAWCELQEKRYNKAEQARFKEEVAILKTLQHPNILKLYDSWESAGHRVEKKDKVLVLVTELMTSGTLKSYMRRLKSIKPKVIRSWGRQILRGLLFLHTRMPPIIHRDLKCDNIFINGTTGLVKIGDLGLATLKRSDVSTVIGTPEFMAPEMYEESYDESVDVYAFGMCLLEMCTQEYPYMECSNPAQIYKRVSQGIRPHAIDKIKDAALRDIIEKCTTVNKEHRFNVQDLLNHEFFGENIKIEVVPAPEPVETQSTEPTPLLTMRMDVPHQDSNKKNGQESIEFPYDLTEDVPEDVVREMVKSGILHNSVQQMVSRSLREYVEGVKQKRHQGRNKDERATDKPIEPKLNAPSHTPSPSPGMINEATPTDTDLALPKIQSQVSIPDEPTSSSVKPDESGTKSEIQPTQGQDMTGQGTIPTLLTDKDRTMSLSMSKVSESKVSELVSPTQPNQSLSEHATSTVQQITASTGQAVPQATSTKDQGLKSQSSSTVTESKSYASVTKKTSVPEKLHTAPSQGVLGAVPDKSISETSAPIQDGSYLKPSTRTENVLGTPVHEVHVQSDTSAESTPVHQPHSDSEYSTGQGGETKNEKTGTLKKKSQRGKGKGIKLSLLESNSENKVIKCQLSTSNGRILKYQFSMKYDKPEEMFRKFVKAGHLTEQEKDDFIQQTNSLIQKAKTPSSSKESKTEPSESKPHNLGIQDQSKTRALEPSLSPPAEAPAASETIGPVRPFTDPPQSTVQGDQRSSKSVHFSEGSPKPSVMIQADAQPAEQPATNEQFGLNLQITKEFSVSGSLPTVNSSSLAVSGVTTHTTQSSGDNVSPLVTHTTSSYEPPQSPNSTHFPQHVLPNTLITGVPLDNLSSCSLPSLHASFPVPVNVCQTLSTGQYASTGNVFAPTTAPRKKFEVESVIEDHPDSPETSDMSAHGSTENLGREGSYTLRTDSQDSNPPQPPATKKFSIHSVPSLESKSDSYIGKDSSQLEPLHTSGTSSPGSQYTPHSTIPQGNITSAPPPATVPQMYYQPPYPLYPDEYRAPSRHHSLTNSYTLPPRVARQGQHSGTIPEHYCTTSVLDTAPTWQRGGITEDTYVNPMYRRNQSYSTLPTHTQYDSELIEAPQEMAPPSSRDLPPNLDDLPQANLLSEAFMRFMHSMSIVFRDPTFHPLITSLDNRFGPQVPPSEPGSAPPIYTGGSHEEHLVMRASTDPGIPNSDHDDELKAALDKIEEEQRKLEKRKQQMIRDFQRRKHSSGNSSLESSSGLPDSRKISTTSYDTPPVPSPTQIRKSVRLNEYEELHPGGEGATAQKTGVYAYAISEMEKRVKDELTADKLRSATSSPSHVGLSSVQEQYETSSQLPKTGPRTPQPALTQSNVQPVNQTKSGPTSLAQPDRGGSLSPSLQTSPPPQTVGLSSFQMHTSPASHHSGSFGSRSQVPQQQSARSQRIPHSDSNEWTEYTSAQPMGVAQSNAGYIEGRTVYPASSVSSNVSRGSSSVKSSAHSISTVSSSAIPTDLSEFDPISSHSSTGPFARPKS